MNTILNEIQKLKQPTKFSRSAMRASEFEIIKTLCDIGIAENKVLDTKTNDVIEIKINDNFEWLLNPTHKRAHSNFFSRIGAKIIG